MTEQLISALIITMGLISSGVGLALATNRVRHAGRIYRRTTLLYKGMPEEWTSWFLGGFSGFTVGTHWLWAAAVLLGWTLAGLCLIGLGLRLFWRA